MTARRRMALLAVIAVLLAGGVGVVMTYSLYRTALAHHAEFLEAVVRTERTLAEQVFRDELGELGDTVAAVAGLLEQLREANRSFGGFGATGEFTVARRLGDTIVFEIGLRADSARLPPTVVLPSPLATPQQHALGGDTGASIETDYAGVRVLAAYGPIRGTGLAVVAKMDLREIRAPHLRAALYAGLVAATLLLVAFFGARGVARSLLAEVEEREDAHRAMIRDFPGVIFRVAGDVEAGWRVQVLEGAVEELTGVPARELRTSPDAWRRLVHEQDRGAFDEHWARFARREPVPDSTEWRIVRPDGRHVWARVRAQLHEGSRLAGISGVAVSGVVLDVTAERRAHEVRARAEAELHALVRHLPRVAMHILDRELRYLYSGGEALADLGLTHEGLEGRHVSEILGPELGGVFVAMYERVLAGATQRTSGEFGGRAFEVTAAPLRGPDGAVDRILVLSVDVTEERRREAESAAAQTRFEAFMHANPVVAWIKDEEGRHLWVNRAWEEAFGLGRDGWLGKSDGDLLPSPLAEETRRHDLEVIRTSRPLAVVEDTGDLGGSPRIWQAVKFPLGGAEGERLIGGIAVDITPQRAAEAARRESESRLRVAIRAGRHGLWDLDLRTGAAQVNDTYATMIGFDPADFVETNAAWRERLHPDDRESVYAEYEAYVAGERDAYRVEFRSRTADGGWRWILSQGEIVERDAEGHPLRMIGTHTDIQPLRDAEAALRESEDRFRRAVEASPEAIFIQTDWRFAYLNPAAVALFGVETEDDLLGTPVLDRFAEGDRKQVSDRIRRLNEAREPVPGVLERIARPDGKETLAAVSAVPFRYRGGEGALVFARDITERIAAEDRIRAQLEELRRWQAVMLDREDRVQELKREVNDLCRSGGHPPRYPSQADESRTGEAT